MSELKTNLQEILQEKQDKIIPENIKKDVQIFDVVGSLEAANYDNTLTPEEYIDCDNTLDVILNGYDSLPLSKLNLFIQTEEPDIKNGIWVKTNKQYENKITVQKALQDTGEYTNMINIPYELSRGSCSAIDTNIYIFTNSSNAYKYDTVTGTYTTLSNVPGGNFSSGSTTVVGTDIYLIGNNIMNKTHYFQKYDTLTDTYQDYGDYLPVDSFYKGAAVSIGTDIYMLGGGSSNTTRKYNYKYDTLTNTSVQLDSLSYPFNNGRAVTIGTDIYLLGGDVGDSTQSCYKYDTLTNTYTQLSDLPYPFYGGGAVAIGTDIYIFGGKYPENNQSAYKYDTLTDSYIQLTDIPITVDNGRAVSVGTDIYIFDGTDNYKFTLQLQTDIPNNSLVFEQGGTTYKTVLFDSEFTNGIEYKFTSVWLKDKDGTIDTDTQIYYGDGTQWIQFKGGISV